MMMKIFLVHQSANWVENADCFLTGMFFNKDGELFTQATRCS